MDKLTQDLPASSEDAPRFYYLAGRAFRLAGDYEKAVSYYQRTATDWPDSEYTCSSLYRISQSYEKLKKSKALTQSHADQAIKDSYEQILQKCPDFGFAETAARWLVRHKTN